MSVLSAAERAYREIIALEICDRKNYLFDEFRNLLFACVFVLCVSPRCRNINLLLARESRVYCRIVHIYYIFALLYVRIIDSVFHVLNGIVNRNDVGKLKEC